MILFLYQLLFPLVAVLVAAKMVLSGRARALREGAGALRERLGLVERAAGAGRRLWLHAASVGEVTALAPFLAELAARPDRPRVLMTTATVAGREKARALPGVDAAALAPADFYPAVAAFLARARPSALVIAETELWPMTLSLCARRGVRLGMINARVTARAFGRYRLLGRALASWLAPIERAAARTPEDAERLRRLGVPAAALAAVGSTKYDVLPPAPEAAAEVRRRLRELGWEGRPLWVAGSTRRGEEELLLEAHRLARARVPGLALALVPRHPERAGEVAALLERSREPFALWSDAAARGVGCLLVDRMGLLAPLFAAAGAAFVGGTLVPIGGHNLLEPASCGTPVLFGPHTGSVKEEAEALSASGGGLSAASVPELARALEAWLGSPPARARAAEAARLSAAGFAGASRRALEHLSPVLFGRP